MTKVEMGLRARSDSSGGSASRVRPANFAAALSILGLLVVSAWAEDYHETFDGFPEPAALSMAGWSLVTGTNNPTTVSTDFTINNNQNVNKITALNDFGSQFTSGHVFLEHDYWTGAPGDNGNDPNNFGRGDALLWTTEPITQNGIAAINLNGAYVAIDYSNGSPTASGPSFQFAFRLCGGAWYVYETPKLGMTTAMVTHAMMSTDPLDNTFTFIPLIYEPSNSFNPDARLIPNDSLARELTTQELSCIDAVGIYVYPGGDALPARFDNYSITGFTVVPLPPRAGDLNCDGKVNGSDVNAFILKLIDAAGYDAQFPYCDSSNGDTNASGAVDVEDVPGLVTLLLQS